MLPFSRVAGCLTDPIAFYGKRGCASISVTLVAFPIARFACGGGSDCGGMELPAAPVPVSGPMENLLGVLSDHAGLTAGLVIAALLAALVARQRQLVGIGSAPPSFAGGTS